MAAKGFADHAARNRARAIRFVGLYCLAFIPVGLLLLGMVPVLVADSEHSLLADPLHYTVRFLPLVVVLSLYLLSRNFFGFRRELEEGLNIRRVTEQSEPRFVRIAEEAAILQGLRQPQYGVIEVPARNAMAIGATPGQRMIVVTRGLLDALDDDELAAVFAHELAHFRGGDATMLSLNHALMRTAVQLQTWNPLKIEKDIHQTIQWQIVVAVFLPILLVGSIVGGVVTMMAYKVARMADKGVRSSRDFVADAEAIRHTHFPEALEGAIARCEGQGYFPGAERFEAMLFAGNPVAEGGTHPPMAKRLERIREIAREMYLPGRSRRDTRNKRHSTPFATAPRTAFGKRGLEPAFAGANPMSFAQADRRSAELPRKPGPWMFYASIFDRKSYRAWQRAMFDQLAWRQGDKRNVLGATNEMTAWVLGALALSVWVHLSINPDLPSALEQMSGKAYFAHVDRTLEGAVCDMDDPACREKATFSHTSKDVGPLGQ